MKVVYRPAGGGSLVECKCSLVPIPKHQQFNLRATEEWLVKFDFGAWLVSKRDMERGGVVAQFGSAYLTRTE